MNSSIKSQDPKVWQVIKQEEKRQKENINLIASENYASKAVREATGSVFTNKYSEGYPFKRYYAGNRFVDEIETLAIERAKKLFGVKFANVQGLSGSPANQAAYMALAEPGDTIMGLTLTHGGHLSHGASVNFSGKLFHAIGYEVDPKTERIDFNKLANLAKEHHPDIVLLDINMPEMDGLTAYREIVKIHPETGCIIISAEKDTTTLRNAISIGVQDYLIKPFTVDELETAINRVHILVDQARQKLVQAEQLRTRNEAYLKQLADEYSKARRTDDQAMEVFERLSEYPQCEGRWMQTLAMIYVVRQKWGKLRVLAEKIEQRTK